MLTAEERAARRKLLISDALSLAIILAITVVLAVAAHAIFESFAAHRRSLAQRWNNRGVAALSQKKPLVAIGALKSALALDPDNRQIQVQLAKAFAAAGQTEQAVSYFKTLAESRPGDGMINLQLARLSARQGHEQLALEYYQRSIFGDWSGDGYLRRREVRLEMVHYLLSRGLDLRARNELLISAGNAPPGNARFLARVAAAMEQAGDPENALRIYQHAVDEQPHFVKAIEGAGRAAFALKHYRQANRYLVQAVSLSSRKNGEVTEGTQDLVTKIQRIILLDPFPDLPPRGRALRILTDRKIAEARFQKCAAKLKSMHSAPAKTAQQSGKKSSSPARPSLLRHPIKNLESHFKGGTAQGAVTPAPPSPEQEFANLQAQWKAQPKRITLRRVERNSAFAQSQIQLVFDTERITAKLCGPPSGDDALLLEMGGPRSNNDE